MNTPIERLQSALEVLGLKAVETRLENLLEERRRKSRATRTFSMSC